MKATEIEQLEERLEALRKLKEREEIEFVGNILKQLAKRFDGAEYAKVGSQYGKIKNVDIRQKEPNCHGHLHIECSDVFYIHVSPGNFSIRFLEPESDWNSFSISVYGDGSFDGDITILTEAEFMAIKKKAEKIVSEWPED